MTQQIVVPSGEDGDEVLMELIPNLHKMAKAEQNARRSS